MYRLLAVALMLVVASAVEAQEAGFTGTEPIVSSVQAPVPAVVTSASSQESTLEVRTVQATERVTTDADAAVLPTRRGSFWWYVAILVVAGVILAIL